MNKLLLAVTIVCVFRVVEMKTVYYYPPFAGPDIIVFDGPTNYHETHKDYDSVPTNKPDEKDDSENEIDAEFGELFDVRKANEQPIISRCPPNFNKVGTLCFPKD